MTKIQSLAEEIIALSKQLEDLEKHVQDKRDAMFGILAVQPDETYEFGGYRFKKSQPTTTFVTFPKQKFIEALISAGLPDEVRSRIIGDSMNESPRGSNLVVSKLSK